MTVGRGVFITFEGGEGSGKSTQMRLLAERLRARGLDVLTTREPGGSPGAEAVRHVLLSGAAEEFGIRMEAMLFAAARADHVEQTIRPAIERGLVVLCDRFMDSTRIYQGVTGNLEPRFIQTLERVAVNGMVPDLTIIVDVPASVGLGRARERMVSGGAEIAAVPDRFEKEALATHEKRREGFLELAQTEPERCHVVDGSAEPKTVAAEIEKLVDTVLAEREGTVATAAGGAT